MGFWWVNQGSTFNEERELGVLWAPLLTRDGRRQSHWDALDRAQVGDVVFHYSKQRLRGVSEVVAGSRRAERPYESEAWGDLGREVRVAYQDLDLPLTLTEIPLDLRLSQATLGSPFRTDGAVKLGYLFKLSREAGNELLSIAGLLAQDDDLTDEPFDPNGLPRAFAFTLASTDGTATIAYRKEQGPLRAFLFGAQEKGECAFCGSRLPTQLLVTAHIKPRSKCTDAERRDPHTVVPACSLGCDALFEHGYLVVDSSGRIAAARSVESGSDLETAVTELIDRAVPFFSERNKRYFDWHRRHHYAPS